MSFSLSAKTHYACLAMLELTLRYAEDPAEQQRPVALREITSRHGIPQPFLVQILQQLKLAGYVTSTRGSQGGYRIAVDPASLTLLDICESIGCLESTEPQVPGATTPEASTLQATWQNAADAFREVLANTRLDELAGRCSEENGAMFYI